MEGLFGFLFNVLYALLALAATIIAYLFYTMVFHPNQVRKALRNYPNVYMSPKATYLGGDMQELVAGIMEDKRHVFSRFEEAILEAPEQYDMYLQTLGSSVMINLCSVEAMEEFKDNFPHSIDRGESLKWTIGKSF